MRKDLDVSFSFSGKKLPTAERNRNGEHATATEAFEGRAREVGGQTHAAQSSDLFGKLCEDKNYSAAVSQSYDPSQSKTNTFFFFSVFRFRI